MVTLIVAPLPAEELGDLEKRAGKGVLLLSDPGHDSFRAFKINLTPSIYLVNEEGRIIYIQNRRTLFERAIFQIAKLLRRG